MHVGLGFFPYDKHLHLNTLFCVYLCNFILYCNCFDDWKHLFVTDIQGNQDGSKHFSHHNISFRYYSRLQCNNDMLNIILII